MCDDELKRVFLYAYDKINLGDDLFLRAIAARYPNVQFYLWTDRENRNTFRNVSNIRILDKEGRMVRFLRSIRASFAARYKAWWEMRCDASVYIGGSIFMEYETWRNQITWLDYQAENHRFFVLGANFGPYQTEEYRKQLNDVFCKMEDVCFRDLYSIGKFAKNSKVRYAPDILFSYPMPQSAIKRNQVFVSVIDCTERELGCSAQEYVFLMSEILKCYLADGCTLVLASFCKEEGDEKAIEAILEAMNIKNDSRVQVLLYNGINTDEMLSSLASSDYIIASRFHGTILAMNAGRPVLPVIYSDKTRNVLEDLSFEGITVDLRNLGNWSYMQSRANWTESVYVLQKQVRIDAEGHFEQLDRVLKEE